jgi:hypothetical protein
MRFVRIGTLYFTFYLLIKFDTLGVSRLKGFFCHTKWELYFLPSNVLEMFIAY